MVTLSYTIFSINVLFIQGSQQLMKKKFREFSLIFPWEISETQWEILSHWGVLFTKATITSQSMNITWTHGTRRTTNWRKPLRSGSLSQIPWVFPEFWCFSQIPSFPWLENWNLIRFSLVSRVAGNPVIAYPHGGSLARPCVDFMYFTMGDLPPVCNPRVDSRWLGGGGV